MGQGLFRRRVLAAYKRCLVTALEEPSLLVASHIMPWSDCRDSPEDCLNADNALLLSLTGDRLFDTGFISFNGDGTLLICSYLSKTARKALGCRP